MVGRSVSPTEVLRETLERIAEHDATFHAYVTVDGGRAETAAQAAEEAYATGEAGPLAGLPVSIKDLFDVEGEVAGCGVSTSPRSTPAVSSAAVVRRLEAAGAVIVGRTHLHPLAFGLTGENPQLVTPQNPRDHGAMPGGSSSGSAVSVAAGLAYASIGTDTGGSVRVPAAFCGVVGFKPSHGAIDAAGVFPVAPSIDHVGVLARSVADCRLIFEALVDPADVALVSRWRREGAGEKGVGRGEGGIFRVGILGDFHERAQAAVRASIEETLASASASASAEVEVCTVRLGDALSPGKRAYGPLVLAEIAATHEALLATQPENYDVEARAMVEKGTTVRAVDYLHADAHRRTFRDAVHALFDAENLDALALPTVGIPAPDLGATRVDVDGRSRSLAGVLVEGTSLFSLIGVPAISVPARPVEGRPVGLQLVARRGDDALLLRVAGAIEVASGGPAPIAEL